MKVSELIARLEQSDPNLEVAYLHAEDTRFSLGTLALGDLTFCDIHDGNKEKTVFIFSSEKSYFNLRKSDSVTFNPQISSIH